MSKREIAGLLTLPPVVRDGKQASPGVVEGNIAFRSRLRARAIYFWDNSNAGSVALILAQPYKNGNLLVDDDETVGHGNFVNSASSNYPDSPAGTPANISSNDYARFRLTGTVGTVPAANLSRVFGSVAAYDQLPGGASSIYGWGGNTLLSINDVPFDYTQIGIVYFHPATQIAATLASTAGLPYLTYTNASSWDSSGINPVGPGLWLLRLETGADAGYYYVQQNDFNNNRLYLRCLNGTVFSALATASGLLGTLGPGRRAYFNEVSIIPLSIGTVETSGRFNPRGSGQQTDIHLRESFIMHLVLDKTGSTEVEAGTEQQGSYYLTTRPYTHGESDSGNPYNSAMATAVSSQFHPFSFNFIQGGASVVILDWEGQRVWAAYTDIAPLSGILHWRYKTNESFREIANPTNTAAHASFLTPSVTLGTGDAFYGGDIGSNRWVYMAIHHATAGNSGLLIIKPDLTTLKYGLGAGFPVSVAAGVAVDKSRARTFADVSTTAATDVVEDNVGTTFTNADVGRVIQVNSGPDAGDYKIETVTDNNTVTVVTLAGAAVSFTGSANVTAEIGDRAYLFFNNNTTGAGKINYMESMAPGTFLTRTVAMTNGANCNIRPSNKAGQKQQISIDPANGNVYWNSGDTQQQINKYEVLTNTHSFIAINNASLLSPAGGSPSNPGTPTLFSAIHVNSKFDHIWVGSDAGHFRITKSTFAPASIKRFFGTEATTYVNPTGIPRSAGTWLGGGNSSYVRNYYELPDGRMLTILKAVSATSQDYAFYSNAMETWMYKDEQLSNNNNELYNGFFDKYGQGFFMFPSASSSNTSEFWMPKVEVDWQWDSANSKWIPLEWVPQGLPNKSVADNTAPLAKAKPIHSGYEDILWGVKVRWNRQGGATPPNNEFLGRGGQTRITATDGSTTTAVATFGGSSFSAGDVGRVLRIESGNDTGIYKITVFLNAASVTLANMNGTAFSPADTAGTLSYTVWDFGTPGSNAGPENIAFMLADGYGKDNTQDITGLSYEQYAMKTVLHEFDEARKFTVPNPLAVPGAAETKVYTEFHARAVPQYDVGTSNHRALPGAETSLARQLFDFCQNRLRDGSNGSASLYSSPSNAAVWSGVLADTSVLGYSYMVDFGADVTVGYIQVRGSANNGEHLLGATNTNNGSIANIYKASGAAPVASSVARTSGTTNLSITVNTTTGTLSSGDFLGPITTGPFANGAITASLNTFVAPAATFVPGDRLKALKITAGAGADIGSYRIIAVSLDGSTLTVRNLDQTAKAWTVSASGITYEVRDSVREEDMIAQPTIGAPTHKLEVERLLSPTTVQVRTGPRATLTNVSWQCAVPTWEHVKRMSFSTEAQPPDVADNGTWVSHNGRDAYNNNGYRYYFDLTDLPSAQRTGRYWKFVNQPRFAGNGSDNAHWPTTWEFYDALGNRMGISKYTLLDEARTNADFLASNMGRIDFIQSANEAVGGTFNGNVNLGGVDGNTLTLFTGGNKFLGFQIGVKKIDGGLPAATNQINSASSAFPANAILGRFIRIHTGTNAGNLYRVATRPSATQITVTTLSGSAVSWAGLESGIEFTVHEGISVGGVAPDRIRFLEDGREFTLATINDAGTTLTFDETLQPARTNKTWEIIRCGFLVSSATTDATKTARLNHTAYPLQSGDCFDDFKGAYVFFGEDIGDHQRADGAIPGGSGAFTGSGFSEDDEGRLLVITTGVNVGCWEIETFTSSTSISVKNHYTGAAVSFTADAGPVTYKVYGDRRFRHSKFVIVLRA